MASSTGGAAEASATTVGSLIDITASTVSSFLDMASSTAVSAGDTTFRDQGMSSTMERLTSTVSYASTEGTATSWDNGTTSGGIFTTDWGGGGDGFCRYCKVELLVSISQSFLQKGSSP